MDKEKRRLYKFYEESAAWWRKDFQFHDTEIKRLGEEIKAMRDWEMDTKKLENERRQHYRWRKTAFKHIKDYITRMHEIKVL